MAADKLIDSTKEAACRTAEANAIRAKTGSSAAINYDFTNNKGFADAIAAIPTGGGSGKNIQFLNAMTKTSNKSGYPYLAGEIIVAKTGVYDCYWVAYAAEEGSSSTYASALYANGTRIAGPVAANKYDGSAVVVLAEDMTLNAGDSVRLAARTRTGSTNYWIRFGCLVICEQ